MIHSEMRRQQDGVKSERDDPRRGYEPGASIPIDVAVVTGLLLCCYLAGALVLASARFLEIERWPR
jgi:hypothetical protein